LCDGLDFLTGLRLRGQLRSLDATGSASAMPLRRDDLDPVERTTLRELLRVVSDVQHATSDRLGLDAVG
jgi:signal-transduction protein with cAMP-binding, CBS, and nucleotidyltransferase domain